MTEKAELLKLLKETRYEMNQLQSELRTISSRLYDAIQNYAFLESGIKRVLNTEEQGNCHLNCEYYKKDSDACYNYLMGVYTGLAFEVSRLDKCIADVIKEHEKDKSIKILTNHNKEYVRSINILEDKLKKLKEENEQLKSTIMEMEDYLGRLEEQIKVD